MSPKRDSKGERLHTGKKRGFFKDGDLSLYLKEISKLSLLRQEQEVELARKWAQGDLEAKKTLITSNLRLVVSIASKYAHLDVPLADLIEEGNLGLMKAVEKFDPEKGFKFSTYAIWWIKQFILRYLTTQSHAIRLPSYKSEQIAKYRQVMERLQHKVGRHPTFAEIAKEMQLSEHVVEALHFLSLHETSLEEEVSEENEKQLKQIIEDTTQEAPWAEVERFFKDQKVVELLSQLDKREAEILRMRYGLEGQKPHTLREISQKLHLTRERIRQIQDKALKKLKRRIEAEEADLI